MREELAQRGEEGLRLLVGQHVCGVREHDLHSAWDGDGEIVRGGRRCRAIVRSTDDEHRARQRAQSIALVDKAVLPTGGEVSEHLRPVEDVIVLDQPLDERAFRIRDVKRHLIGEELFALGRRFDRCLTLP